MQNKDLPIRSVEDDFICILNTYIPRYKSDSSKISPENNIDCPFGELGLLDILNKQKHIYKKSIPPASSFNDWCILAVIMDYAINHDCEKEIQISSLLTDEKSIGKIFNLDSMTLLDILHSVEKTNELKIVRTAGLDVVNLQNIYTFEECVAKFYESVSEK